MSRGTAEVQIDEAGATSVARMKLLTANEAAALLRCSPRTIYDHVREGKLPYRKDGRRLLFVEAELLAHLDGLPGVRLPTPATRGTVAGTPPLPKPSEPRSAAHATAHPKRRFRLYLPGERLGRQPR